MPRNRTIYASEAVYVGPSPITGNAAKKAFAATGNHFYNDQNINNSGLNLISQLWRVQNANYSFAIPRKDVNQFGELAEIDRVPLEQPTVTFDTTWLMAGLTNEQNIGLIISSGGAITALSGILMKEQDGKNLFIKTVTEGSDADNNPESATSAVIGFGNAFLTSYEADGSVGNFPTAAARFECLNMQFYTGTTGQNIPAVLPGDGSQPNIWQFYLPTGTQNASGVSVSALHPGDITLNIYQNGTSTNYGEGGPLITDLKIQSYKFTMPVNREKLLKLGNKYAFSQEIRFPVTTDCTIVADIGDQQTGNLSNIINNNGNYDVYVSINKPFGAGGVAIQYSLLKAKLDAQDYASSIGANKRVTMKFGCQASSPQRNDIGLFLSGIV